jgi:hypothetical protein
MITSLTTRERDKRLLAAVSLYGGNLGRVRTRCASLTDAEFRTTARDLVQRRAIVRTGTGMTATVQRDLGKWLER